MDPLVILGSALVGGALFVVAPVEALVACAALGALLFWHPRRLAAWAFALAGLAVASGAWRARAGVAAHEALRASALEAIPSPGQCSGTARVVSSPVLVRDTLRWDGDASRLACEGAAGAWSGRVTLYGGPPSLARGDEVEFIAHLAPPQRLWNGATGDPRPGEARRGVLRSGGVVEARVVRPAVGFMAWIDRARAAVRARIGATFPADTAAMARAIVLGESDLTQEDDADFRASGLAHLLAVSGMHLVLVVAGAGKALRAILVRVPFLSARLDVGRVAAAAALPLIWTYAEFAGAGGSTLRAAWMMTAASAAVLIGRRSTGARAFGLSLVAMAAFDPLVIFDLSFLLSAGATAGLLSFSRPLARWLAPKSRSDVEGARRDGPFTVSRWAGAVAGAASVTLAATIPCAPILARFAPTLPLGGVVSNLLAVPVGEAVALPLCLLHAALAWWAAAERGAALVASGALVVVRGVARASAHAAWLQVNIPPPNAWQLAFIAAALAACVLRKGRARAQVVSAAAAAILLAELASRRQGAPRAELRATFLDVGQGDAALVDLPDGDALIIDGGGLVGSPLDTGARVIAPTLRARRRAAIAVAMLSHAHPDHFTGLATGLEGVRVAALWDTGQGEREGVGGAYAALLARERARGTTIMDPLALCGAREIGGARVEVLAPCPASSPDRGPNDNSIVVRLSYGSRALLFVGDAEHDEEADLIRLGPSRLHADVLKVGHHGSRTSTGEAFLAAVAPTDAVISAGIRNRFGHPHPATLRTLAAARVRVWRTDRDGEVTATTDGTHLEVKAIAR